MEGRPLQEHELVRRAKEGDLAAYGDLVRLHQEAAFRLAYFITRSREEAEDAAQEGLMKAHRSLASFRDDAEFRPWVLRIVANTAKNRVRSVVRRRRRELAVAVDPGSGDAAPSPEPEAVARVERERLLEAVDRLPERFRLVVVTRYLMDLSVAEAGEVLGVAEGTVKSRLSRALDRLRSDLGEDEGE